MGDSNPLTKRISFHPKSHYFDDDKTSDQDDQEDEEQDDVALSKDRAKSYAIISKLMGKSKSVTGLLNSPVLQAYMGFNNPKKRRREYLIPKDKAAWLEWMVTVAKKRVNVEYLTDKELRKVIVRARPNLDPYKKVQGNVEDPDVPACISWSVEQVGEWIASSGWPHLKDTFVNNMVTGRKLILVDCSALSKMGLTDLPTMRKVAAKIRELLGIPPPNQMRPVMRIPPFERFLRRKVYNGRSYDELTFEKFCEAEGFNYELVTKNRNLLIPCTTEVTITTPEHADADEDGGAGDSDEDHSLRNAPTVEFLVRNALVRNKTVEQIMEDIMESVFLPPRERKYGKDVWGQLKRGIGEGYDDLHLHYPKQRLEFAAGVAHALIDELYKTVAVLNDINKTEKHIIENVSEQDMDMFKSCAQTLIEEALPIVGLLALGELDLETIFKQDPELQKFAKGIAREAEKKTNALVPEAKTIVDEVISEALNRIPESHLSTLETRSKKKDRSHHISRSGSDTRGSIGSDRKSDRQSSAGQAKGRHQPQPPHHQHQAQHQQQPHQQQPHQQHPHHEHPHQQQPHHEHPPRDSKDSSGKPHAHAHGGPPPHH